MNTCIYCGKEGEDVNKVTLIYVGGKGDVPFPMCDDTVACLVRVWEKKEKGGVEG